MNGRGSVANFISFLNDAKGDAQVVGLDDVNCLLSLGGWLTSDPNRHVAVLSFKSMKAARSAFAQFKSMFFSEVSGHQLFAGLWPLIDYWGPQRYQNPLEDIEARLDTLSKLYSNSPLAIFTVHTALHSKTISTDDYERSKIHVRVGQEIDTDTLSKQLDAIGYQRRPKVEEKGYYSMRGGLVDVFPAGKTNPVRFELLGDQVSSIRVFSEETQRSVSSISEISIAAVSECIIGEPELKGFAQILHEHLLKLGVEKYERQGTVEAFHERAHFAGYFKLSPLFRNTSSSLIDHLHINCGALGSDSKQAKSILFNFVSEKETKNLSAQFLSDVQSLYDEEKNSCKVTIEPERHFYKDLTLEDVQSKFTVRLNAGLQQENTVHLSAEESKKICAFDFDAPSIVFPGKTALSNADKSSLFETLMESSQSTKIIVCESELRIEKMTMFLKQRSLSFEIIESFSSLVRGFHGSDNPSENGIIYLTMGRIDCDLNFKSERAHLIPSSYFWGSDEKEKSKNKRLQNYLKSFKDLKEGDLVVHVNHGVGEFLGMETMTIGNLLSDFLVLKYAGGDKVYVPVDKVNFLQRYAPASSGSTAVPLDRLTGSSWEKRKNKVRSAVEIMAEELIAIHAKRAIAKSKSYGAPPDDFEKFIEDFPYQETPDQLSVMEDIEADFRSSKNMDRLVVGDVGFGKTEIALRAAFRAVIEGYQAMIIAPTTVLCFQHYETFKNRLEKYGVSVRPVNRFVKTSDIKEAREGWAAGTVDVLVGTHRLLNKLFVPRRLGLMIVDEEQRFGVGHKERIKEIKANAAILTLSATPIPRTLHMSMLGLRDISLLATPPDNRIPVKNFLINFDEQLIKNAVEHEIKRGGQVFIVHNRVEDIAEIANFVSRTCAGVEVRVGHGQMGERELETTIVDFISGKFPVLVCTTIIESGVDMPNVNTILVNNAHHFGLSQLYQLRGRVGRSATQAYAYFMTPSLDRLSEDSRRRLQVLMANQDLGSGFQIASHDMEIRGAGSVLGEKQSGHVSTVGIELYTKMLESAIVKARGEKVVEEVEPEIKINASARISPDYILEQTERLAIYKQIFSLSSEEEVESLREDMEDRYGQPPTDFLTLLNVAIIKIKLKKLRVSVLKERTKSIFELKFFALSETSIRSLEQVARQNPSSYQILSDFRLLVDSSEAQVKDPYHALSLMLDGIQ